MLRVKSFKIEDDAGINELLIKYRLAQGSSIFVSNGLMCVPYEDGEPANNDQKRIIIAEDRNKLMQQVDVIEHSQAVLKFLMKDAGERVNEARANLEEAKVKARAKEKYMTVKEGEDKLKEAENAYKQLDSQLRQNEHEILRLNLNIELFNESIDELSA